MNKKINKKNNDDDELESHLCYAGGVAVDQDDSKTGEKAGRVKLGHDVGSD